ncbi:nuclease-related domain-containing DEAD/DEAH box helicase [Noviherbaspirillum galbum]|uniref:ATP-binding domain-containing protein n=1 Tax=Noviherbaspirillum galbum TaxID=2709383 RepID=A0A6B3SUC4_9BURK|nr:NERD domain-containing protein [Noviherbaspirillum galbum]NEX62476.1 ATP-binding domain-containing protein [Noviherbaspirillum galbum]
MARLIPAFTDERTPPGERDVFTMLAAGPDDWTAIHSLDLAPWNRGLRTEIDFVIIVPDTGIICIEVKSHSKIDFEDDRWIPAEIKRSPFKQAADGRYTFYRRLVALLPQFQNLPVVHGCVFPNARFTLPPNLSAQPWELIDGVRFRSYSSGMEFCADLKQRMQRSIEADQNLLPLKVRLSGSEKDRIVEACIPVHKRQPGAREEIQQRELEIGRILREQQKPVLRLASLNQRLVVDGAAGTGKTLIAVEVARRAALAGKRVALLCFNRLAGDWIRAAVTQNAPAMPNLVAGRAIRVMAEMAGIRVPENPHQRYWDEELPLLIEDKLTDPDFSADASFDYLVLDEAQDLLGRPRLWNCLCQFLSGGVKEGNFALFGDFSHQVLGEKHLMDSSLQALLETARPTRWLLAENCRNYQIVGDTALRLSGFGDSVYSGYMRTGGSLGNYDISFYNENADQLESLRTWLADFRKAGYKASEIAILSFCADAFSAASRLAADGCAVYPAGKSADGTLYSTIHAFKGLERKVIILTDLALAGTEFQRHLFYTGMTRATESVRILCHKNSKIVLRGWLRNQE